MQCTCYWFMQLKQIVLHRSWYLNCYLILWLMMLFVLNVTQRARALSRRAEETEAAGNEENQYLYWYFHTLLCTLCNHKVSVNLHPGKGCWDALLAQGSRALGARTGLQSPVKIWCPVSTPVTEVAFTELTNDVKCPSASPLSPGAVWGSDSAHSAQSMCCWHVSP